MGTEIEAKTETVGDHCAGLPPSISVSAATSPSSSSTFSRDCATDPGVAIPSDEAEVSGAISEPEPLDQRRPDLIRQVWEEAGTMVSLAACWLKYLEYLNAEHSASIFAALEKLTVEFAAIIEELATMEGLLARKPGFEIGVLKRAKVVITEHMKRSERMCKTLIGVYAIEGVLTKSVLLTELFSKASIRHRARGEEIKGDEDIASRDDEKNDDEDEDDCRSPFRYPFASKLNKIIDELHCRTMAWIKEVQRRAEVHLEQTAAVADGEGADR